MQVDRLGQVQAVAPATSEYQPTDAQIAYHLARFIGDIRGLPVDPILLREQWLRAYDFTTDRGAAASVAARYETCSMTRSVHGSVGSVAGLAFESTAARAMNVTGM